MSEKVDQKETWKVKCFNKSGYYLMNALKHHDYFEEFIHNGFKDRIKVCNDYFFNSVGQQLFEINIFINPEKQDCICSFWDYNRGLFDFHCDDEWERFVCIERFISMAKNMVEIEYKLKKLNEDDE
jgi:hypothetical protein